MYNATGNGIVRGLRREGTAARAARAAARGWAYVIDLSTRRARRARSARRPRRTRRRLLKGNDDAASDGDWARRQCLSGDRSGDGGGLRAGSAGRGVREDVSVGGGARDGTSVFPRVAYAQMKPLKEGEVDFQHFHTYEEATMLLRKWAAAYPNLVELYSVGQSLEGREIWQITITNKKTGRAHRQGRVLHRGRAPRRRDHRHRGDALLRQPRPHELRQGRGDHEAASTRRPSTRSRTTTRTARRSITTRRRRCARPCGRRQRRRRPVRRRRAAKISTATASSGRCASSSAPARARPSSTSAIRRAG